MIKTIIYSCVFFNEKYIHLINLLLKSYKLFGNSSDDVDYLIICDPNFQKKIQAIFDNLNISGKIWCIDLKTKFEAGYSRLKIFDYPNINLYNKILYLDCDILVTNSINNILDFQLENKLYALQEGNTKEDPGNFWGSQFFDVSKNPNCSAFSSGVLLFNNNIIIKDLFSQILLHIQNHITSMLPIPGCLDQPFIVYHAVKNNLYDNQQLINIVINCPNIVTNFNNETISHFPGGPGDYELKVAQMSNFMKNEMFKLTSKEVIPEIIPQNQIYGLLRIQNSRDPLKLLDHIFFEKNIHKFDTATCYGRSEQIFGQWVSSRKIDRNSFYIICKGGHHSYQNNKLVNRINLKDIFYDIKSSFNKLKIEFADCFMFHRDDENVDPETIYTICEELLNKNLCKNIGASNWKTSRIQSVNEISIKRTGKTIINSSQIFMNYITLIKEPYPNIHKIKYEDYLWYQENKNHEVSVYSPVCFINSDSNIHKNIIFKNILEFLSVKFNESKEKILYVLIENVYNLNVKCITGSLTPSHIYKQVDLKKLFNLINSSYPNLTDILSSFLFDIPAIEPTNNIKSFIQNGFVGPFKMKNYDNNIVDEIKDYILNINKGDYNLLKNHHETNTIIQNFVNNKTLHDIVNEYIGYECACWSTEFFIRDNNDDFKYTSNWHIDTYFDINEKYPHFTIQIGLTDNDINNSLKCIRGSHLNDYQQNYDKQDIGGFAPIIKYDESKIKTELVHNLLSNKENIYLFSNYLTHGKGTIEKNSSIRVGLTLRLISKQAILNISHSHVSKKIFYLGSKKNFYLGSKINNNTPENKTHNLIWQSVHNSFLNYCKKYKGVKNDFEQPYYGDPEVNENIDLCNLGLKYLVDKSPLVGKHSYTKQYNKLFKNIRNEISNFLEIGIGNIPLMKGLTEKKYKPGASLRMWEEYFPNSNIFGCDILKDVLFEENRIKTFHLDQSNIDSLEVIKLKIPDMDVILDDGSHIESHMVLSFQYLWNKVKIGGYYIIEDVDLNFIERITNLNKECGFLDAICILKYTGSFNSIHNKDNIVAFKKINIFETRNDMLKHYCSEIKTPKILEIGVFKGEFLGNLVENCDYSHIDAVDLFEGVTCSGNADGNNVVNTDVGKEYVKLTEKYKNDNNITINKAPSADFLKLQNDNTYDIIYIDGDHSYEGVKKDLEQSYHKIKNGRYIMGHDYEMNMNKAMNKYNFGVKRAVDEFCKKYSLSIISKGNDGCVSFCIKVIKDNKDNKDNKDKNIYTWENSNIEFLENGKMNAFGVGKYSFIDKYLVKCDFGGREHLLKFNEDYSRFFSVRKDDFEVVVGNHF